MTLLYINSCVRVNSRTNMLAKYLLSKYVGHVEEIVLNNENICGLNSKTLKKRDELINNKNFNDEMFKYAKQFANSDTILISAPLWDLSFPAILKAYFEYINVNGITFYYTEKGECKTLCKAKKLIYITTSGGPIVNDDYGFGYIKALSGYFYGISKFKYFKAEGLDIIGNNFDKILENTKMEIASKMQGDSDFNF